MFERDIYTIHSTYREDMRIKGFQFGKGEKSACIVGAARGNEIQQMYICSQLVKTLRELENNGCISAGKQILVIPTINAYSVNISRRFFGVKEADRTALKSIRSFDENAPMTFSQTAIAGNRPFVASLISRIMRMA